MKLEKLIFVADFDFLKNFLKSVLGAMCGWFWNFKTPEALQNQFHVILKHIERIWEIRIFDSKKNFLVNFLIILKHFLSICEGFWWCEVEKINFFKKQ